MHALRNNEKWLKRRTERPLAPNPPPRQTPCRAAGTARPRPGWPSGSQSCPGRTWRRSALTGRPRRRARTLAQSAGGRGAARGGTRRQPVARRREAGRQAGRQAGWRAGYHQAAPPPSTVPTLTGSKLGWITPLEGEAFLTCARRQAGKSRGGHSCEQVAARAPPGTTQRRRPRAAACRPAPAPAPPLAPPATLCNTPLEPLEPPSPPTSAIRPGLPVRCVAAWMAPMKSRGCGLTLAAMITRASGTRSLQGGWCARGRVQVVRGRTQVVCEAGHRWTHGTAARPPATSGPS